MKAYAQQGGASVYDNPIPDGGERIFRLAGGTAIEVMQGYGDFYAIKVYGRSKPAYIDQLEVDLDASAQRDFSQQPRATTLPSEQDDAREPSTREAVDRDVVRDVALHIERELAQGTGKPVIVGEMVRARWPEHLANRLVEQVQAAVSQREQPPDVTSDAAAGYARRMVYGLLLAGGGVLLTCLTYSIAASDPRGGTYYIFYGLMVVGAIQFVRALLDMLWTGTDAEE